MSSTPAFLHGRGGRGRGRGRGGIQPPSVATPLQNVAREVSRSPPESAATPQLPFPALPNNFTKDADEGGDSDGCDDDDVNPSVYTAMVKSYASYSLDGNGDTASADAVVDKLMNFTRNDCCLICLDDIKRENPIYSCQGCFESYHLQCIQTWVRDGVAISALSTTNFPDRAKPWYCPKCRKEYNSQTQFPSEYTCFCAKVIDPPVDPWTTPHSCGDTCGRDLGCGHKCVLLCHPGPCPPCPRTVQEAPCYCGARRCPRRCGDQAYSCGGVCSTVLGCGNHKCVSHCHAGPCKPCPARSVRTCVCGAERKELACAAPAWKCGRVCGKALDCGHHVCEQVCCNGNCGVCPMSGDRQCPCGKSTLSLPCTEDIPTCGKTCGKVLECGQHSCTDACHRQECGPCRRVVPRKCRCGKAAKEIPCSSKPFTCNRKCVLYKNCGRHTCKRKCCDGDCPPCDAPCNRMLSCGQHRCQAPCHSGPCYPCTVTASVPCACQATVKTVPCGREHTTKPPHCKQLCQHKSKCHHPRRPHACHFGPCPECTQMCGRSLSHCEHFCAVLCHTKRLVPAAVSKVPVARLGKLSEPEAPRYESTPCPPCVHKLDVACVGGHSSKRMKCSAVAAYSCGKTCGKELACGQHTCTEACHDGNCHVCVSRCEKPRPPGCAHACPRTCHTDACLPCNESVSVSCHCGKLALMFPCPKILAMSDDDKALELSCRDRCGKNLSCGHRCPLKCHRQGHCAPESACKKKIVRKCRCGRLKQETQCNLLPATNRDKSLPCDDACKRPVAEAERLENDNTADNDDEESVDDATEAANAGSAGESAKVRRQRRWQQRQAEKEKLLDQAAAVDYSMIAMAVAVLFGGVLVYYLA